MVKKLFKHEISAYTRILIPMHLVLLGIALLGRFVQLFENDSTAYHIVFWSSVTAFIVGAVVCALLTLVFGIRRFYTNLFTGEGYLSFTLPVTPTQHIWVKNIVALIAQLFSFIGILLSCCVITLGDVCVEAFKAFFYIVKQLFAEYGFHTGLYIVEFFITVILGISVTYMLFYACIALGQRAKKNRVAAAVGIFFAYYVIMQIISTIFIIIVTVFHTELGLDKLFEYLSYHPILEIHLYFAVMIVLSAIGMAIFFPVTNRTIKNRLNLE